MSSFQLGAGPIKRIYVNREAAASGQRPWVVESEGIVYSTWKFTIMPDGEVMESCGPPDNPPLHPRGPALWLETTAAIDFPS